VARRGVELACSGTKSVESALGVGAIEAKSILGEWLIELCGHALILHWGCELKLRGLEVMWTIMRRCELQCTLVEFAKKGYEGSVDRVGSSCVEMAAVVLTRVFECCRYRMYV